MVRELFRRLGRHPIEKINVLVRVESCQRFWCRALGTLHGERCVSARASKCARGDIPILASYPAYRTQQPSHV
jgi:hypothetical protein